MIDTKKQVLKELLEKYRLTGDETLILELFDDQESINTSISSSEMEAQLADTPELVTEDTMVFSEVYTPIDNGYISLTSPTFEDDTSSSKRRQTDFLNHSDYVQTGVLGSGGMGTVLQVQDPLLKRKVAMKVLHAETSHQQSTFLAEAQISALLQHPSIIPIYEFGTIEGTPYFTMQEIRGTSLKKLLKQRDQLELRELISILHSVTEAIAYAHSQGIVHRDLKPSNILVGEFGEVYVVDWGIAVVLPNAAIRVLFCSKLGKF